MVEDAYCAAKVFGNSLLLLDRYFLLACTSLEIDPLAIIRLYSCLFQIEHTFRELKQQIGAFCYHFWSKYMPKLSYYQKKGILRPWSR